MTNALSNLDPQGRCSMSWVEFRILYAGALLGTLAVLPYTTCFLFTSSSFAKEMTSKPVIQKHQDLSADASI